MRGQWAGRFKCLATKRAHIDDEMVIIACVVAKARKSSIFTILHFWFEVPKKVAWRAVERAIDRGYLDYGTSINYPWIEEKAKFYLLRLGYEKFNNTLSG
jgi:hypothetical protein